MAGYSNRTTIADVWHSANAGQDHNGKESINLAFRWQQCAADVGLSRPIDAAGQFVATSWPEAQCSPGGSLGRGLLNEF